ncbi:membrane hypothetical protein [Azospirillaceae bacterium]
MMQQSGSGHECGTAEMKGMAGMKTIESRADTSRRGLLAACAVAGLLFGLAVSGDASAATRKQIAVSSTESFQLSEAAAPADSGVKASEGLSDATKQGIGCLASSGFFTGWAMMAGSSETLMIVAGGMLAPSATTPIMMAFVSTLTAATCALGAAATPAVLWAFEQSDAIGANLAWQAGNAGREFARLPGRLVAGFGGSGPLQLAGSPERVGS